MTTPPTPPMIPETRPQRRARWPLWLLWLWLLFVGFFSLMSVMLIAGCSDAVCEARFMRIWGPLMVAQGVVIVAGVVLAIRGHLTAMVWLAAGGPVLWLIAALLWQMAL